MWKEDTELLKQHWNNWVRVIVIDLLCTNKCYVHSCSITWRRCNQLNVTELSHNRTEPEDGISFSEKLISWLTLGAKNGPPTVKATLTNHWLTISCMKQRQMTQKQTCNIKSYLKRITSKLSKQNKTLKRRMKALLVSNKKTVLFRVYLKVSRFQLKNFSTYFSCYKEWTRIFNLKWYFILLYLKFSILLWLLNCCTYTYPWAGSQEPLMNYHTKGSRLN